MTSLPLAHIVAKFNLEGVNYDVEKFKISFIQPTDFKGQPQHEVKGGQLTIALSQTADDTLYLWAKKSSMLKNGIISFQTDIGITVLEINFTNAYCVNLTREINAHTGTSTVLIISPEKLKLNGVEHDNYWVK